MEAIHAVTTPFTLNRKENVERIANPRALIEKLGIISVTVQILTRRAALAAVEIRAVLGLEYFEAESAIFGIKEEIPRAVFGIHRLPLAMDRLGYKIYKALAMRSMLGKTPCPEEFRSSPFILLLAHFLVKDVVRGMREIRTTDTVIAPDAVKEKCAVPTLATVLRVCSIVTIARIDALITPFAILAGAHIHAILALDESFAVVAILEKPAIEDEVAIFARPRPVRVVAILRLSGDEEPPMRHSLQECIELPEKRSIRIVRATMLHRIPSIARPTLLAKNVVGKIRMVHADDRFLAERTGAII